MVVPAWTVPRRLTAPDWKSSASTSDVFPVPRWPTTATLRILAGSGMGLSSSSGLGYRESLVGASRPLGASRGRPLRRAYGASAAVTPRRISEQRSTTFDHRRSETR